MKKILAFCFFPAFTPPVNGGQSRLFNFYSALSAHHQVTLLTSTHAHDEEERVTHGPMFIERRVPKDRYFIEQYAELSQFGSGGDLSGPALAASSAFPTLLHRAYLQEYGQADIIIHDFPFTTGYDIYRGLDRKLRVYNSHNCESTLYRQLHPEARSAPIHALVDEAEIDLLKCVDQVHYCSEADLEAFLALTSSPPAGLTYVPNGTALRPATKGATQSVVRSSIATALFMGSGHPPNMMAARFVVEELAPRFPDIEFRIVGSCLPEGRYVANVKRLGIVTDEEKEELIRGSDIALNPMTTGSGSNLKVLDYFAHGVPVISTEFGMRGIHATAGQHYLAASLENFESTLHQCMARAGELVAIGNAGRGLAEARYSWTSIAQNVAERLTSLCEEKHARPRQAHLLMLNDYESYNAIGGGCTRTRGLCAAIAKHQPVVFLSFTSSVRIKRYAPADNVTAIAVPWSLAHRAENDRTNAMSHISCADLIASRHCDKNKLLIHLYDMLRQDATLVVVEHCYMTPLPMMFGDRFIYSSQNVESVLKRPFLNGHPRGQELMAHLENLEGLAVRRAAAVVTVCDADARALQALTDTSGPVIVVPNGAAEPPSEALVSAAMADLTSSISPRSVVFVGSAHMPNIECAHFIRDVLAPQCKDVEFHIVGSACNGLDNVSSFPANIRLWGELDECEKSGVMNACAIAINPMSSGGGSNIKLADYLAHGKFVVTTEFGQRGYPQAINEHIEVATLDLFSSAVRAALKNPDSTDATKQSRRKQIFAERLSMEALGGKLFELIQQMQKPSRRVLFVTYRYTDPALGGAEVMIGDLIKALAVTGDFQVDVVAPALSEMRNHYRFAEQYSFQPSGALMNVPNLRYRRFALDGEGESPDVAERLSMAWQTQPLFEQMLSRQLQRHYAESGLTWGWAELIDGSTRHALASCGLHIARPGRVALNGVAEVPTFILAQSRRGELLASVAADAGRFSLEFDLCEAGEIQLLSSRSTTDPRIDPRPRGFFAQSFQVGGEAIDLRKPTLIDVALRQCTSEQVFHNLASAAEASRFSLNVRLTDVRGPFSSELETFLESNVQDYDLVVTHNNIFRPAVVAIDAARRKGVPTVLVPHGHFDDDYYHFPDIMESARAADVVLAAPKVACKFLQDKGCAVEYLPSSVDTTERFTEDDVASFRLVYGSTEPFVLVLGRKAGAKNYRDVIDAVEQFNRKHGKLRVVMIGPDDDGVVIDSRVASVLGRQPREVVRGALLSSMALVNMSASESFGIVLLEAWLAEKPVVVNKRCAAFHDMAVDRWNALVVEKEALTAALVELWSNPDLGARLASNGRQTANEYDVAAISSKFVRICQGAITQKAPLQ